MVRKWQNLCDSDPGLTGFRGQLFMSLYECPGCVQSVTVPFPFPVLHLDVVLDCCLVVSLTLSQFLKLPVNSEMPRPLLS